MTATMKALFAEWRKISPSLGWSCSEREARLRYASEALHREVCSWSDLKRGEQKALLRRMREASGSDAEYRAMLIARLAMELFGAAWERLLAERLKMRFQIGDVSLLTPIQAHAEIEELMSRIARRDGAEIEAVRARFSKFHH
jgi:hypothetical protein